jgi:hypothetical protein
VSAKENIMDRNKADQIISAVREAVAAVEAKYGIKLAPAKGTYTNDNLKVRLEFSEPTKSGEFMDSEAKELQKYASIYGLPEDAYGKEFYDNGRKYKVVGIAPRRSRFPIIVQREDGKKFKYPLDLVKFKLGVVATA